MVAVVHTVTFLGIEAVPVEVQVHVSSGLPGFTIVGLPDKAVGESRERVKSALTSIGIAFPPKKITVNLSPADVQKVGSHFDLPIALGLMVGLGALSPDDVRDRIVLGELSLDGRLSQVSGVLPAALLASSQEKGLICPRGNGSEAAWADDIDIIAAPDLIALMNHLKGKQILQHPKPQLKPDVQNKPDLSDIKGQESAKRALEIAAAGGHNLLMQGPPGSGKSMLASRLPGILPPLTPAEALETTMIHSVAGFLNDGQLIHERPFRDPHHSASLPALVGGSAKAKPGEISLAHQGVLFLDELPEFNTSTLETLRQPLETGKILISRANHHVSYPARFQLIAAMNPCRCGYVSEPGRACSKAPKCATDYQAKLSGPLLDRIDLNIFVHAVSAKELSSTKKGESSASVAKRVAKAREIQARRFESLINHSGDQALNHNGLSGHKKPSKPDDLSLSYTNASISAKYIDHIAAPDEKGRHLLNQAVDRFYLSARGYHRILRVARTLADLESSEGIRYHHIAEAIHYRHSSQDSKAAA